MTILGHDAGNGVGNPVTLDAENDANFVGVLADASGMIVGAMSVEARGSGWLGVHNSTGKQVAGMEETKSGQGNVWPRDR